MDFLPLVLAACALVLHNPLSHRVLPKRFAFWFSPWWQLYGRDVARAVADQLGPLLKQQWLKSNPGVSNTLAAPDVTAKSADVHAVDERLTATPITPHLLKLPYDSERPGTGGVCRRGAECAGGQQCAAVDSVSSLVKLAKKPARQTELHTPTGGSVHPALRLNCSGPGGCVCHPHSLSWQLTPAEVDPDWRPVQIEV
jgi:hypothetical protein